MNAISSLPLTVTLPLGMPQGIPIPLGEAAYLANYVGRCIGGGGIEISNHLSQRGFPHRLHPLVTYDLAIAYGISTGFHDDHPLFRREPLNAQRADLCLKEMVEQYYWITNFGFVDEDIAFRGEFVREAMLRSGLSLTRSSHVMDFLSEWMLGAVYLRSRSY